MSSPDDVPSTSKRTDNDGAIDYGTLDTDMEHDIVPYIDGSPTPPLLKTPPGMKTSSGITMDQIGDQFTGDVVDAMDQTPHELGREFVASDHESTYHIQSTSDTVMEPDQSIRLKPSTSPLPWPFRDSLSPSEMVMRQECLKEDRTPLPLRTSPGRMTPSDDGVGPDSMGFPKSGDGKTSPIPPELQAFWDDFGPKFMELQKSPDGKTSPILSELQTLLANESTSNLNADDKVRIEDYANNDLINKLELIPQTHQPTETCNDEETNLPGDEVKPTKIEIGVQLPVLAINGKHLIPVWKQFDQTANRPELNNAAPSPSSNAIGPSRPSTSGTPVRGSKRTAKGNERAENKRLKGVPLYARKLTDDEELNNSIRKARTTKLYHEEKKRREKELKSQVKELTSTVEELTSQLEESQKENTDLRSEDTDLKSENTDLKSENTDLKSENTDLKSENTDLKSENTDLKSENTDLKSQHN